MIKVLIAGCFLSLMFLVVVIAICIQADTTIGKKDPPEK